MKLLLKRWHGRCHTHTHTFVFVLFVMLFAAEANAQNQGQFEIPSSTPAGVNPFFDPATGITRCTINWINNTTLFTVNRIYVDVSISGTSVCLNNNSAASPTIIHPGFTGTGFTNTFTATGLTVTRPSTFSLPMPQPYAAPNTPFIILQFRTQPGMPYSINISGYVNNVNTQIVPANTTGTPAGYSIVGTITKPILPGFSECLDGFALGNSIPNVTVNKTATVAPGCFPGVANESDLFPFGFYQYDNNLIYTTYRVRPSKDNSTDICCGIDGLDVKLWDVNWVLNPYLMTNQQALAADFNGDGAVSVADKALILACANGLPPNQETFIPGWVPWRFAPLATFPPDALISMLPSGSIPNYIDVISNGTFLGNASFWGVKRGDLDNDCEVCGSSIISGDGDDRSIAKKESSKLIAAQIDDFSLLEGEELLIPVKTAAIRKTGDIMLELQFDPGSFEVLAIEEGFLKEEYPVSGIVRDHNKIAVRFAWLNTNPVGVDIPENSVLFYVRVRALKNVSSAKNVISHTIGADRNLIGTPSSLESSKFDFSVSSQLRPVFQAALGSENPTASGVKLLITLPEAGNVRISTIDGTGKVISSLAVDLPKGTSEQILPALPSTVGVYTMTLQSDFGQQALRLVKL